MMRNRRIDVETVYRS